MDVSVCTAMPDDRNCRVIEHLEARPLRARRGWSADAKARLIEETLVPGANVSAIARRAGMAPSQLFGWRRQALAPIAAPDGGERVQFTRFEAARGWVVEIVIGDVVVRASPDVGTDQLAAVLRAVRQA